MSRTYKDRHRKLRFPDHIIDEYERVPYTAIVDREYDYNVGRSVACAPREVERSYSIEKPGVFTKKKRWVNDNWHWTGATPGWWIRTVVNRPIRRKGRMWEREMIKAVQHAEWISHDYEEYLGKTPIYVMKLVELETETPRVARGETSVPYYW